MQIGTCALCGIVGKLHDSHFLLKSVYRLLRRSNNGNLSPVLMSRRASIQSDFQMKQPLLCSACERRFSENGESYVVPLLNNGRSFPLLDRLKLALPLYTTSTNTAFVCPAVGLSGGKIGYFGLSILWRAAVRQWRMFDGDATSVTLDPAHLELVRGYLAGETAFPDDALAVTATVATDFLSQNLCFGPSRVTDNQGIVYSLLTKGLYYRFVFGENHPPQMRAISCIGTGPGLIFLNDASDKAWEPCAGMMETTVPKGSLAVVRS